MILYPIQRYSSKTFVTGFSLDCYMTLELTALIFVGLVLLWLCLKWCQNFPNFTNKTVWWKGTPNAFVICEDQNSIHYRITLVLVQGNTKKEIFRTVNYPGMCEVFSLIFSTYFATNRFGDFSF